MTLKWNGHACFTLKTQNGLAIVTDPFDASVGYECCADWADIVTISHAHHDHNDLTALKGPKRALDQAGEFSQDGARIRAISSYHDDAQGAKRGKNLIFRIEADGESVVHLGDLGHMPTPEQLRFISGATVLFIPIGGYYTIDTAQALDILRAARPQTAIPMHYKTPYTRFPIESEALFAARTGAARASESTVNVKGLPPALILPL